VDDQPNIDPEPPAIPTPTPVIDEATLARARDAEAAWAPGPPTGDAWTARAWVHPSVRYEQGRQERKRVPRASHGEFTPRADRDPMAILGAQEADRLQFLVPLRHQRMGENAFAYYSGTPAVMAYDLAPTPRTDILVQASSDAHCANFGIFASPERQLVFDANDFDETMPGPWEWDVKRLATSIVIAGRANGFSVSRIREATLVTVRSYREWMTRYAGMRLIDVWYSHITAETIEQALETQAATDRERRSGRTRLDALFGKARGRDALRAADNLTTIVDGRRIIIEQPPVVQHVDVDGGMDSLRAVFESYLATLSDNRREFLERFRFTDFALKVVGVGSVGTRCFVFVLEGRDEGDPLILQAKEATASVLEGHAGDSSYRHHGERVVMGQRLMQATPDIFLGWTSGPAGRHFYIRQLWDMKGSVDTATLRPRGLGLYGGLCAWALARAHSRSGDSVAISSYLGTGDAFDGAVADFAETYADVNEADHRAYRAAIADGRIAVPSPD